MKGAILFFVAAAAFGQVGSPRMGLVPDGSRIRVMNGIPGAGFVGSFLDVGRNLDRIAISPRQDYALATAADTGEVVRILPGGAATSVVGARVHPGEILMSPNGTSAALWFADTYHAQIISGLSSSPSVWEVDASYLGDNVSAIAVSDDGEWLALAMLQSNGVYLFRRDGSVRMLPSGDVVMALAFFHDRPTLAIATPGRVITADAVAGLMPVQMSLDVVANYLVVSADNLRIVASGGDAVSSFDLVSQTGATVHCDCTITGLDGLGGDLFRLTNSGFGGVKLFDAATNRVLDVPRELSAAMVHGPVSTRRVAPRATTPLPAVTIGGLPASSGPAQQPAMTISLASAYPVDVTGTATLTFASSVGGDDQTIQFGTGGRTVNFTIPTGSLTANFSGKANVTVLTGTTAGTITIKLAFSASGADVTPSPAPTATISLLATVPFIQTAQLQQGNGGFTIVVTGFSTTHDMVSGLFHFAPASNATLATPDVTVQLGQAFAAWFSNSALNATGGAFTLTVPFTTQNGSAANIVAATITLTNSKGTSNPAVNQ